jgi:hypothetical protein
MNHLEVTRVAGEMKVSRVSQIVAWHQEPPPRRRTSELG